MSDPSHEEALLYTEAVNARTARTQAGAAVENPFADEEVPRTPEPIRRYASQTETTHLQPTLPLRPRRWGYPESSNRSDMTSRRDRLTRASALSLITDVMLNEDLAPIEVVDVLEDIAEQCKDDGVPFSELLAENMYVGDVPPLVFEIHRCDWDIGRELVMYLLTQTAKTSQAVRWMVKSACIQRGNDELFQHLREVLGGTDGCEYQVSVVEANGTFETMISIFDLEKALRPPPPPPSRPLSEKAQMRLHEITNTSLFTPGAGSSSAPDKPAARPPEINIEWIIGDRAWTLQILDDRVTLRMDVGTPGIVTANLRVVSPIEDGEPICLAMFPETTLFPIRSAGKNSVSITPSMTATMWTMFTVERTILLQLDVRVQPLIPPPYLLPMPAIVLEEAPPTLTEANTPDNALALAATAAGSTAVASTLEAEMQKLTVNDPFLDRSEKSGMSSDEEDWVMENALMSDGETSETREGGWVVTSEPDDMEYDEDENMLL
ncbi:hypothetical protein FRB99_005090 [Tulasnella sp. 403]|nr:hypothetical protein FRB99_005090 [Tulasnella sp. 403]